MRCLETYSPGRSCQPLRGVLARHLGKTAAVIGFSSTGRLTTGIAVATVFCDDPPPAPQGSVMRT